MTKGYTSFLVPKSATNIGKLISIVAFCLSQVTTALQQPKCKEKFTCGLLRDCCTINSECFSACCD